VVFSSGWGLACMSRVSGYPVCHGGGGGCDLRVTPTFPHNHPRSVFQWVRLYAVFPIGWDLLNSSKNLQLTYIYGEPNCTQTDCRRANMAHIRLEGLGAVVCRVSVAVFLPGVLFSGGRDLLWSPRSRANLAHIRQPRPWLSGKSPENLLSCSLLARKRVGTFFFFFITLKPGIE